MNIEYLKYFAELAKIQHYGKAAKALNISQPGLSHAIKTLGRGVWCSAVSERRAKCESESLWKRADEGCG